MSKGFEKHLKSAMTTAGNFIERAIGQAQKAKARAGTRSGVQPILSLESVLGVNKIGELVAAATERMVLPVVPELDGCAALDMGEGPPQLLKRFVECQARLSMGYEIGGGSQGEQGNAATGYIVRGKAQNTPFPDNFFDYVAARLATPFQGDILRVIKELGRIMSPGGQGVFIDYHPYGMYAKKGPERLRAVESSIRGVEDYYRISRAAGLRVVDVREAFIDENIRSMFTDDTIAAFRMVKGSPLTAFLFLYKPRARR